MVFAFVVSLIFSRLKFIAWMVGKWRIRFVHMILLAYSSDSVVQEARANGMICAHSVSNDGLVSFASWVERSDGF